MASVDQKLVRDITMLLQTRGVRLAARGTATNTDAFKVFALNENSDAYTAAAGVTTVAIEFSQALLTALSDDKAFGAEDMIVPSPDRA